MGVVLAISSWLLVGLTAVITLLVAMILRAFTAQEKKINYEIEHSYGVEDDQFLRSLCSLLPPAVLDGNKITRLKNGSAFFPVMLDAITGAKRTVVFETFIYWEGEVGQKFADALSDRAKAGVKVHVLLDWLGTKRMDRKSLQRMEESGVEVERYHPLKWYHLRRINNRTHRKLLVVDGQIAFTGGAGIADQWTGNAEDPDHWRDSHFKIEGPVVVQCQAAFMDNWLKTRSRVLHSAEYFPPMAAIGPCKAAMFTSSSAEGSESARLMYLMSIACAKRSLKLSSAYFVPDTLSVQTLVEAQKRGVKVEIIVPGKYIDTHITRRAGRSRWGPLLEAGIAIYEYQPTMFHCKVMVVDELWTSVGSANFDNRSFRLNDEANLNIYDREFARLCIEDFEGDKTRARRITLEEWQHRPWTEKLKEHTAGLFRSQL